MEALCSALKAGHIEPPYSPLGLVRLVGDDSAAVSEEMSQMAELGMKPSHVLLLLEVLLAERRRQTEQDIEVVTTGPDVSLDSRDTAVVTRELFAKAKRHVLAVGYAVHQGDLVFRTLAERLDQIEGLNARICLDISRKPGDTSVPEDIIARFAERFTRTEWPGKRLPQVYFDPRSLVGPSKTRTSLHAKCIVVDGSAALVTSANFTQAAHERNIELGLYIKNSSVSQQIEEHFAKLILKGHLRPIQFRPH